MPSSGIPSAARTIHRDALRLLRFLAECGDALSPLFILTHDYPDPDSIASAFALKLLAERVAGVSARIVYGGIIGRTENREMVARLKIPVWKLRRGELSRGARVALVDTQPAFRNNSFAGGRAAIVIDQHRSVRGVDADLAIVNVNSGATSVILAQALLHRKEPVPSNVATALAYGILSDTLNLYRADNPAVVRTYMNLLPYCDMKTLARIQNPDRSRRFFMTLGRGIREAMVCRHLIVAHLGEVETPDLVSQTAEFFLTYKRMQWALSTGRYKGRLHMSLRTTRLNAEAGEVLRDICGDRASAGGHGPIAGGSFEVGSGASERAWQTEEAGVLLRLLERLRISRRRPIEFPFRGANAERLYFSPPLETGLRS